MFDYKLLVKMFQNKNSISNSAVKIIPLGGLEQIGLNCTVIEYKNSIIIVDMGLGFPEGDLYGIDYVLPNVEYLKNNKHKIKAIVITHGHLDHIGALPFVLKDLGNPKIIASRFAAELIKNNLTKNRVLENVNISLINNSAITAKFAFDELQVSFFRVNHSIPESFGVVIKTPQGTIVHTGDFKFDNSPSLEPVADYNTIAQIGSEGVLALMSDSTNSFVAGHSKSEYYINNTLQDIIEVAKGRVVIATFASLVTRIIELFDIAIRTNRKVVVIGRSMEKTLEIADKLGYLGKRKRAIIPIEQMRSYPNKRLVILATGAQGEEMAALPVILRDKNPLMKIEKGDSVILSASVIPGNDLPVQDLIDELSIKGAIVFQHSEGMDLHTSGHGSQEDQKIMLNLTKPRFFIPVHGYQSFLYKHAQTAENVGIPEKNIIIPSHGQVIELTKFKYEIKQTIKCPPILVSGSGIGDIGIQVLKERQQLGNNGLVLVSMNVNNEQNGLTQSPQIITKGFTFYKDNTKLFDDIALMAEDMLKHEMSIATDVKDIKQIIIREISNHIRKVISREPIVLVLINGVIIQKSENVLVHNIGPEEPNITEQQPTITAQPQNIIHNTNSTDIKTEHSIQ